MNPSHPVVPRHRRRDGLPPTPNCGNVSCDGLTDRHQTRHNPSRTVSGVPLMGRGLSGDGSRDLPLPGDDRDSSAGSCGLPRETRGDLRHGPLGAVAWLGMVASALVASMPRIGCRSQGRDRRNDEQRTPRASESDGDQRVDRHPAPTITWVPASPPTAKKSPWYSSTSAPHAPSHWSHGREPGFHRGSRRLPAVTWCPGGVVGQARHRGTPLAALRDELK